jgi:hypothetical protein
LLKDKICDQNAVGHYARDLRRELWEFIPDENSTTETANELLNQCAEVFRLAAEIQSIFMKSKAIFAVAFPEDGGTGAVNDDEEEAFLRLRYDSETMDPFMYSEELGPQTRLYMAMSPVLRKTGSADGHSYDTTQVLVKANVICN